MVNTFAELWYSNSRNLEPGKWWFEARGLETFGMILSCLSFKGRVCFFWMGWGEEMNHRLQHALLSLFVYGFGLFFWWDEIDIFFKPPRWQAHMLRHFHTMTCHWPTHRSSFLGKIARLQQLQPFVCLLRRLQLCCWVYRTLGGKFLQVEEDLKEAMLAHLKKDTIWPTCRPTCSGCQLKWLRIH